jgi:UDP-glucose 4-epimerase
MKLTFDKVLVTGGAGFVGSHTVDALMENGARAWVLDNLSSGSLSNLRRWSGDPNFHFVRGTVLNSNTVSRLVGKVDGVIHLAAVVSTEISLRNPALTHLVNVSGTLNVLNSGLKNQVQKIVFASSSSVYGDSKSAHVKETEPNNPLNPYGVSKLAAEKYCQAYNRSFGIKTVSLRYFNVYGERQSHSEYSGVVAIFANKLLNGSRPTIFGSGRQRRDFIHVSDVARANLMALQSDRGAGQAFNVGTGRAISVLTLFHLLANITGSSEIRPIHRKERRGDIKNSCADMSTSERVLQFHPQTDIEYGLEMLVKWLQAK